jgi:hypothetical protein
MSLNRFSRRTFLKQSAAAVVTSVIQDSILPSPASAFEVKRYTTLRAILLAAKKASTAEGRETLVFAKMKRGSRRGHVEAYSKEGTLYGMRVKSGTKMMLFHDNTIRDPRYIVINVHTHHVLHIANATASDVMHTAAVMNTIQDAVFAGLMAEAHARGMSSKLEIGFSSADLSNMQYKNEIHILGEQHRFWIAHTKGVSTNVEYLRSLEDAYEALRVTFIRAQIENPQDLEVHRKTFIDATQKLYNISLEYVITEGEAERAIIKFAK